MSVSCDECNATYELGPENTVVYTFSRQPWLSYIAHICPLAHTSKQFFGPERWEEMLRDMAASTIGFICEDFASEHIVAQFQKVYGLEVTELALTPRHEHQIGFLAWLLANTDPMDEFEQAEPPRTENDQWNR